MNRENEWARLPWKNKFKMARMLLLFKLSFFNTKTPNTVLICVMIAIVVSKEKKCLNQNIF